MAFYYARRSDIVHAIQDGYHLLTRHVPKNPPNVNELRLLGLRRSGNHAVTEWLCKLYGGRAVHLNNIPAGENPFRHRLEYPEKYPGEASAEELRAEAIGRFSRKNCLLYSYEDYSTKDAFSHHRFKRELYIGRSEHRSDLILLRDPYNLMASRIKAGYFQTKYENGAALDLWIEHAIAFLDAMKDPSEIVPINYNRWASDAGYRTALARRLGAVFMDVDTSAVPKFGGGSSFDGQSFDGHATRMRVLDRWRQVADHPNFRQVLDNPEVGRLSRKIFGEVMHA